MCVCVCAQIYPPRGRSLGRLFRAAPRIAMPGSLAQPQDRNVPEARTPRPRLGRERRNAQSFGRKNRSGTMPPEWWLTQEMGRTKVPWVQTPLSTEFSLFAPQGEHRPITLVKHAGFGPEGLAAAISEPCVCLFARESSPILFSGRFRFPPRPDLCWARRSLEICVA